MVLSCCLELNHDTRPAGTGKDSRSFCSTFLRMSEEISKLLQRRMGGPWLRLGCWSTHCGCGPHAITRLNPDPLPCLIGEVQKQEELGMQQERGETEVSLRGSSPRSIRKRAKESAWEVSGEVQRRGTEVKSSPWRDGEGSCPYTSRAGEAIPSW